MSLVTSINCFALETSITNEFYIDGRYTLSKGELGWTDNWLGKGRYGGETNGATISKLRLAEFSILTNIDINWNYKAFLHLKNDPEQKNGVDVVEAYVKYQPVPKSTVRYGVKAGLFFPKISRENVGIAWTTPYTITPSAINSWVGEEIRVFGLELEASHKNQMGRFTVNGAVFGFNDPAGTLLAYRGWGLGDAKVGARGEFPLARLPSIGPDSTFVTQPYWVRPVREIDERLGYYIGADWRSIGNLKLGVFFMTIEVSQKSPKQVNMHGKPNFGIYMLKQIFRVILKLLRSI